MSREGDLKMMGQGLPVRFGPLPAHLRYSHQPTADMRELAKHPSAVRVAERILDLIDNQRRDWFKHSEITQWSWPGIDSLTDQMNHHKIIIRKATQNGGGSYWKPTAYTRAWCLCVIELPKNTVPSPTTP